MRSFFDASGIRTGWRLAAYSTHARADGRETSGALNDFVDFDDGTANSGDHHFYQRSDGGFRSDG
jgi:hypothetical protein